MKKIILIPLVLFFIGCTAPIDKKYDKTSETKDLLAIRKEITVYDYKVLKWQLSFLKLNKKDLSAKRYQEMLANGKERWNDTLAKRKSNLEKQKQKEKEALKKQKIKLFCNIKWGMYYYKPDYLEVNPDAVESNPELASKAFKLDPNNSWIIFYEDGTCKVKFNDPDKTAIQNWSFVDDEIVFSYGWKDEKGVMSRNKTTFKILDLDDKFFNVSEVEESINLVLKSELRMKKMG
ncbi:MULTISPECIES: hypothetical protein [unclassified Cellulophaga]|uniref:hypothetical protein n=1 Tax=unclassified Cellulophaga TaxID=2634405 RepID=UPI000C2C7287|nr:MULTISPECIES: hypothetical protein [unclassified Cellulophaga]MDO6492450.1 hypothetical protein [Cellulophaga sp. 2_MG-2023]MDO6496050.1 hypothetical protein [Cellulophaga sp. 3_MG-2023]PKB44890.1 hypothetical protein AX016_3122 [Cellulophaga sp. RHA19]